jgi:integrase/recombinase XerD
MRQPKLKRTLPTAWNLRVDAYLTALQVKNYSADTVSTRRTTLGYFIDWCNERSLEDPASITRPILESYQRWLFHHKRANDQPLTFRTQNQRLRGVQGFFKWLTKQNHILHNPASELELPRLGTRLPKHILNTSEVETVLRQPNTRTVEGLRDRTMLETFYSTAMRRMELVNLKVWDIDQERGFVTIRQGKGKKDRVVPIGERALAWIAQYVSDSRPQLLTRSDDGTLFLTKFGEPFDRDLLTDLVRRYLVKSGVNKSGGCHLFRHTAATLMLENGADVRVIQELLGHAQLSTTEIYTRVSINLLKQIHAATHPAAKIFEELDREAEEEGE